MTKHTSRRSRPLGVAAAATALSPEGRFAANYAANWAVSTHSSQKRVGTSIALLGLLAGGLQAAWPPVPASAVDTPRGCTATERKTTCVYGFAGGEVGRFVVPKGVRYLDLTVEGGGGGLGALHEADGDIWGGSRGGPGGAARMVSGTLPVQPDDVVRYVVGGAGVNAPIVMSDPATEKGGGAGGAGAPGFGGGQGGGGGIVPARNSSWRLNGGGGGGATVVSLNRSVSQPSVVAGGGGGGGAGSYDEALHGGAGGGRGDDGPWHGAHGKGLAGGDGGIAGGGDPGGTPAKPVPSLTDGGSHTEPSKSGGGGGGGGGFPRGGAGGKGGGSSAGLEGSGGGGGAGDSWIGGAANSPSGSNLLFATMTRSERGGAAGRLTISYTNPFVQMFTSATPSTTAYGSLITYGATVESYSGVSVPNGTITFTARGVILCRTRLEKDPDSDYRSEATCQTTKTPAGTINNGTLQHDLRIQFAYSGDEAFAPTEGSRVVVVEPWPTRIEARVEKLTSGDGRFTARVTSDEPNRPLVTSGVVNFLSDRGELICPVVDSRARCDGRYPNRVLQAYYHAPDPADPSYYGWAASKTGRIQVAG